MTTTIPNYNSSFVSLRAQITTPTTTPLSTSARLTTRTPTDTPTDFGPATIKDISGFSTNGGAPAAGPDTLPLGDASAEATKLRDLQTRQQLAVQSLSIGSSATANILSLFR